MAGVVLLESDSEWLLKRKQLLMQGRFVVTTARSPSDLFVLRGTTGVALVILSDFLGRSSLRVAAETVRWQWPMSRILVLGKAQGILDDHLYDEAIEHSLVQTKMLDAMDRLLLDPWRQREQRAGKGVDARVVGFRRQPVESDSLRMEPAAA